MSELGWDISPRCFYTENDFEQSVTKRFGPPSNDICLFCCRHNHPNWCFPLIELTKILKNFNDCRKYLVGQESEESLANRWFSTLEEVHICYENLIRTQKKARLSVEQTPLPLVTVRQIHDHFCHHNQYKVLTGYSAVTGKPVYNIVGHVIPWRTTANFTFGEF
jgi:hypothetical protein